MLNNKQHQPIIHSKIISESNELLVSVEQIKTYLRSERISTDETIYYHRVAVDYIEKYIKQKLSLTNIELNIALPVFKKIYPLYTPVIRIIAITYKTSSEWKLLDPNGYISNDEYITLLDNLPLHGDMIKIQYETGYNKENVPYAIKQAILELILSYYNHENSIPDSVHHLLSPIKRILI